MCIYIHTHMCVYLCYCRFSLCCTAWCITVFYRNRALNTQYVHTYFKIYLYCGNTYLLAGLSIFLRGAEKYTSQTKSFLVQTRCLDCNTIALIRETESLQIQQLALLFIALGGSYFFFHSYAVDCLRA